jgi:hypothetical protein
MRGKIWRKRSIVLSGFPVGSNVLPMVVSTNPTLASLPPS